MKRYLIILAAAIFATACSHNKYTLVGAVPQWCRDNYVNIKNFDANSPVIVDSIPLTDGKFIYEGKIDSLDVIVVTPPDESVLWNVILEPGTIYLNAYSGAVSGTPLNDAIMEYDKESVSLQYSLGTQDYDDAIRKISSDFMNEHIDDVAGAYVFLASFTCHTDAELKDIIARSGPKFYSSNIFRELQKKYPGFKK